MFRFSMFVLLVVLVLCGCKTVQMSVDDYNRCINDPVCVESVEKSRKVSYSVVKGATNAVTMPSVSEGLAFIVSNLVAFGVGVVKGKKKRL